VPPEPQGSSRHRIVTHPGRNGDFKDTAARGSSCRNHRINCTRKHCPEHDRLRPSNRIQQHGQTWMVDGLPHEFTKIIRVAAHDDTILGHRITRTSRSEAPRKPTAFTCVASKPCARCRCDASIGDRFPSIRKRGAMVFRPDVRAAGWLWRKSTLPPPFLDRDRDSPPGCRRSCRRPRSVQALPAR